jgi:hypothetical protein
MLQDSNTPKIFKMPRKDLNFFKPGALYKLKYNSDNIMIRYSVLTLSKYEPGKNYITDTLVNKFNITYELNANLELYGSYNLEPNFVAIDSNSTLIRTTDSVLNGERHKSNIFKHVPVFLFHHKAKSSFVGSFEINPNNQNLKELFGDNYIDYLTDDGWIYLEHLFEPVT